jgi:predicted RNase H-like HicB family nuclease
MDIEGLWQAPYHRQWFRNEDGTWSGEVAELEGVFASGDTLEEVVANLEAAMELWFEVELEAGREIPRPWGSRTYSGVLNLRMPKALHEVAARRAKIEGVSLNQYLVSAIATQLGRTVADASVRAEEVADDLAGAG